MILSEVFSHCFCYWRRVSRTRTRFCSRVWVCQKATWCEGMYLGNYWIPSFWTTAFYYRGGKALNAIRIWGFHMSELGIKGGCREGPDRTDFSSFSAVLPYESCSILLPEVWLSCSISWAHHCVNKTLQEVTLKGFGLEHYLQWVEESQRWSPNWDKEFGIKM